MTSLKKFSVPFGSGTLRLKEVDGDTANKLFGRAAEITSAPAHAMPRLTHDAVGNFWVIAYGIAHILVLVQTRDANGLLHVYYGEWKGSDLDALPKATIKGLFTR